MTDIDASDEDPTDHRKRLDSLFTALADKQRRLVLQYFQSTDRSVASVAELVDYTAEATPESPSRDRLELRFHHCTLPKLDDLGVIEYDTQNRVVQYRGSPVVTEVLTVMAES